MKIPDNFDDLDALFKKHPDSPVDFVEFLQEPMIGDALCPGCGEIGEFELHSDK